MEEIKPPSRAPDRSSGWGKASGATVLGPPVHIIQSGLLYEVRRRMADCADSWPFLSLVRSNCLWSGLDSVIWIGLPYLGDAV